MSHTPEQNLRLTLAFIIGFALLLALTLFFGAAVVQQLQFYF